MNIDIKSKTDNKLLDRKEIEAEVSFVGATPSKADLKQEICGKVGANPDLTILREIRAGYGTQRLRIVAHSYANKESLMAVEPEHIKRRYGLGEKPKEEKPKEEKKEEPKKEEKPKEEKKEEKKAEEKPKEEKKPEAKEKPKEEKKEEKKE